MIHTHTHTHTPTHKMTKGFGVVMIDFDWIQYLQKIHFGPQVTLGQKKCLTSKYIEKSASILF